jgi:MOSC domain-containing protein YiiM
MDRCFDVVEVVLVASKVRSPCSISSRSCGRANGVHLVVQSNRGG